MGRTPGYTSPLRASTTAFTGEPALADETPPEPVDGAPVWLELPEGILSVAYNAATFEFGVAAVKNRHDKADPGAKDPVMLIADLDRCRFYSDRYQAAGAGVVL